MIARFRRTASIARKEFLHVLRDPMMLFFTLFLPFNETLMLGYAIDTNVRHVRTVVLDQARTQESRALVLRFANSEDFRLVGEVGSDAELHRALVAGKARVGIKISEDYTRRLLAREPAQVLILVDGSEARVAATAVNVGNAVVLREALERLVGDGELPVEARPRVLFNPDTRSPNFFLPGLLVVLSQVLAVMLAASAIVREKESGTLEQLSMTPVRPGELILGKLSPYLVVTFAEFGLTTGLMRFLFRVPIHGNVLTLVALTLPFVLTMLAVGLWLSTWASTRDAALQMAIGTVVPSIFLSGYVFPLDSMPVAFRWVAHAIPTTWLIDAARGVILRGAGWAELWPHAAILWAMAVVFLLLTVLRFRRQLG